MNVGSARMTPRTAASTGAISFATPFSEATGEEVALAERDALHPKDRVGHRQVEVEVRRRKPGYPLPHRQSGLEFGEVEREWNVVAALELRGPEITQKGLRIHDRRL